MGTACDFMAEFIENASKWTRTSNPAERTFQMASTTFFSVPQEEMQGNNTIILWLTPVSEDSVQLN